MNVTHISTIDGSVSEGNSMRVSGLCRSLYEMGHSVSAICASSSEKLMGEYSKFDSPLLRWYGPRSVLGSPSFASSFIGKTASLALTPLSRIYLDELGSSSVIHCHQHWAASIVQRRNLNNNQRILFDFHDTVLPLAVDGTATWNVNRNLLSRVLKWERKIFERADMVSFVSPVLRDRIVSLNDLDPGKTCVIPDGVDFDFISRCWDEDIVAQLRFSWNAEEGPIVMYVGSLGPLHGGDYLMDTVCDLLSDVSVETTLKCVIIGRGSLAGSFLDLHKTFPGRIIYIPGIPYSSLPTYLAAADILLVPHPRNLLMDSIESGKLITYLASGKPTVVTRLTSTERFLDDGVNSILCNPDEPSTMIREVKRLVCSPELRNHVGARGAELVKGERDWKTIAQTCTEVYCNLQ